MGHRSVEALLSCFTREWNAVAYGVAFSGHVLTESSSFSVNLSHKPPNSTI